MSSVTEVVQCGGGGDISLYFSLYFNISQKKFQIGGGGVKFYGGVVVGQPSPSRASVNFKGPQLYNFSILIHGGTYVEQRSRSRNCRSGFT